MNINKVTAIFDEFRLKEVEETLIRHGVKGFTLHHGSWPGLLLRQF
jgi:nitrogen regulatory protein P-II 1